MDSFLLMLSVALGALCTVLLLKIAFGEKREETDTAALEAAIRDALGEAQLHPLVLLYSGWELVWREETSATTT